MRKDYNNNPTDKLYHAYALVSIMDSGNSPIPMRTESIATPEKLWYNESVFSRVSLH